MCDKRCYQAMSNPDERDRVSEKIEARTERLRLHAIPIWKSGKWQGGPSCRKETVWGSRQ